jgi:hypothetical protein
LLKDKSALFSAFISGATGDSFEQPPAMNATAMQLRRNNFLVITTPFGLERIQMVN